MSYSRASVFDTTVVIAMLIMILTIITVDVRIQKTTPILPPNLLP